MDNNKVEFENDDAGIPASPGFSKTHGTALEKMLVRIGAARTPERARHVLIVILLVTLAANAFVIAKYFFPDSDATPQAQRRSLSDPPRFRR